MKKNFPNKRFKKTEDATKYGTPEDTTKYGISEESIISERHAIKDGIGNIIITENFFKILLTCLEKQKSMCESPKNSFDGNHRELIQKNIDVYHKACLKILNQKYVLNTADDGYYLFKYYDSQQDLTHWSDKDVDVVNELFKGTRIKFEKPKSLKPIPKGTPIKKGTTPLGMDERGFLVCEQKDRPWLIERPLQFSGEYLTISEDGKKNRPWKFNEIEGICWALSGYDGKGESRNK